MKVYWLGKPHETALRVRDHQKTQNVPNVLISDLVELACFGANNLDQFRQGLQIENDALLNHSSEEDSERGNS